MLQPTIATLFTENEIYSILLMRNMRLRELRDILLKQLNFFRSIEKRITNDVSFSTKTKHIIRSSALEIQNFNVQKEY
jgi:hypothetical protein